ncbi:GNAT family N-acetyltransferase [Paenibacillus sp. MMS18-CY102]|uniref:GNAT family N-acetyltransferase n=1 Tax=Paenibacillus sp. MMS18-CY102 TaxID=2682849 RepID=UPI003FA6E3AA
MASTPKMRPQLSGNGLGGAVYESYHAGIGRMIGFRPVSLELDFERLLRWQHEPHVIPFWKLNISEQAYREHLEAFLADDHQTLYIGLLGGEPMSYFEAYWANRDIIGRYYDPHPEDQGIHLLIGEPSYLGRGYAAPLLKTMMRMLLQHGRTEKLVAEPDVRNDKMIHIFSSCGFEWSQDVELPDKTGALMFASRERLIGGGFLD